MIAIDHDNLYSLKGTVGTITRMAISPKVNEMRLSSDPYSANNNHLAASNSNSKTPTLSSKMSQRKETN